MAHLCGAISFAGIPGCVCVDASTAPSVDSGAPATVQCAELVDADPWKDLLGKHTLADRGAILGCVHTGTISQAEVSQNPLFQSTAGPSTNGYEEFILQYVSEGRPGVARAVTALLYLPSGGPTDVPIVALGHPTSGVGASCGPSHLPLITDTLAVPLVGRGYAVVASDYAGMGVDNGTTSDLVGAVEAAGTLDAVRALRSIHDPRFDATQLGTDFFVAGHSQGGHAALFTHELFDSAIGVRLLGSIAIAPGLGSALQWSTFFQDSSHPVGPMETFALMSLYSHMLYAGAPDPSAWLSHSAETTLPALLHDQCLSSLVYSLPQDFPTLGDLYQPSFLAGASSCTFQTACPGFEPWASELMADEPGHITSKAPSLIIQGLSDTLVPPATTACIVDRMKAGGTPVQACGYAGEDHLSIVASAMPAVIHWIERRRAGEMPKVCPALIGVVCSKA